MLSDSIPSVMKIMMSQLVFCKDLERLLAAQNKVVYSKTPSLSGSALKVSMVVVQPNTLLLPTVAEVELGSDKNVLQHI
jgi:hypothetical protein